MQAAIKFQKDLESIETFLSSTDMEYPINLHLANAAIDAISYRWSRDLYLILVGWIKEKYEKKTIDDR